MTINTFICGSSVIRKGDKCPLCKDNILINKERGLICKSRKCGFSTDNMINNEKFGKHFVNSLIKEQRLRSEKRKIDVKAHKRRLQSGRKVNIRKYQRNSISKDLINYTYKQKVDSLPDMSAETMKNKLLRKKPPLFSQPLKVSPSGKLGTNKNIQNFVIKLLSDEIQGWSSKLIFADTKYRGVRAIIIIERGRGLNNKIEILSRTGNKEHYAKFLNKYKSRILDGIDEDNFTGDIILDAEIFVTKRDGSKLPQGKVTGYAVNPDGKQAYRTYTPSIEVFDALLVNSTDIRKLPLTDRKKIIDEIIDGEGGLLNVAETLKIRVDDKLRQKLTKRFKKVQKEGHEGLVIKDYKQPYVSEKSTSNKWRKLKTVDSIDLELLYVEKWPTDTKSEKKDFEMYKHFRLVPSDNDAHIMKATNPLPNQGLNFDAFKKYTKKWINQWKNGKLKGQGKMFPVSSNLQSFYGVSEVPNRLYFPKGKRPILEIYAEEISSDLKISSPKIVAFRIDKVKGDSLKDISDIRKLMYGE